MLLPALYDMTLASVQAVVTASQSKHVRYAHGVHFLLVGMLMSLVSCALCLAMQVVCLLMGPWPPQPLTVPCGGLYRRCWRWLLGWCWEQVEGIKHPPPLSILANSSGMTATLQQSCISVSSQGRVIGKLHPEFWHTYGSLLAFVLDSLFMTLLYVQHPHLHSYLQ